MAAAATNPGVQLIAVELRGVWLGPRGDNAPLCNHPNPTHPPSNPPTPLKSPPRKSWVAINQSTKYQCSATNKQNENTNQPPTNTNQRPRAQCVGNSWVVSLILIDVKNSGCKNPVQEICSFVLFYYPTMNQFKPPSKHPQGSAEGGWPCSGPKTEN